MVHLRTNVLEVFNLLFCRFATANYHHWLPLIKRSITSSAIRNRPLPRVLSLRGAQLSFEPSGSDGDGAVDGTSARTIVDAVEEGEQTVGAVAEPDADGE